MVAVAMVAAPSFFFQSSFQSNFAKTDCKIFWRCWLFKEVFTKRCFATSMLCTCHHLVNLLALVDHENGDNKGQSRHGKRHACWNRPFKSIFRFAPRLFPEVRLTYHPCPQLPTLPGSTNPIFCITDCWNGGFGNYTMGLGSVRRTSGNTLSASRCKSCQFSAVDANDSFSTHAIFTIGVLGASKQGDCACNKAVN